MLAAIHRALRPGGLLYLETPNLHTIQDRQLGPGHVILYSIDSLAQLVAAAGFTVIAATAHAPGGNRTYDQLALVARRGAVPAPPVWRLSPADRAIPHAVAHPRLSLPPSRIPPVRVYRAISRRVRQRLGRWRYVHGTARPEMER